MKVLFAPILFLVIFSSCVDRKNILVTGTITDELTNKPIANAEVVVICWYMISFEEASYDQQTVMADEKGRYRAHFNKGHAVGVASKAEGHNPDRNAADLEENQINLDLKLAPVKENPTLIKYLSTDTSLAKIPFLGVRVRHNENSSILNFTNTETWGFDLLSLKINTDTTKCDIWFKHVLHDSHGTKTPYIIVANKGGGIIPVYSHEIKSSFFYDKPLAPKSGYKNEYVFIGNEDGFFVLCRDNKTFGKIIFQKSLVDKGDVDETGSYTDFGKYFSCLYQPDGTRDLSFPTPHLDLENFLVDGRLW